MRVLSHPPVLALLAVLPGAMLPAAAADLTLDGATDVEVVYGSAFTAQLSGAPGAVASIYFDVDPGPQSVAGVAVPLGLTPSLGQLALGVTDGAGTLTALGIVPNNPSISGLELYFAGLVLDPSVPSGLDVSSGASLTVVPPVDAGADQAAFVGRGIALDGSGAADPDGLIPAGTSLLWELVAVPAGSSAAIDNADQPVAVLTPDLPGTYRARLRVSAGGVESVDETEIDVFDLALAPALDGTWTSSTSTTLAGSVLGPVDGATLSLNGAAIALGPGGTIPFQSIALTDPDSFESLLFEVTTADGAVARERQTLGRAAALPMQNGTPGQLTAFLSPAGLAALSEEGEEQLLAADLDELLLGLPATQVANDEGLWGFTIFSATVKFTAVDFDPNLSLSMTPINGAIDGLVQVADVVGQFDVWGELLEVPYNLTGTITSSSTDLSGALVLGVTNGQIVASLENPTVVRNGFGFDLDGFFGSLAELFIIESWVKDQVESAVAESLSAELAPTVEELLGSYELSVNLFETLGVDVQLDTPVAAIESNPGGVTIRLDGDAQVVSSEPGSPAVTHFPATFGPAPSFGATTPSGAPFGAGLAASAGFLNLVLAASTGAGLLDGDLTALVDPELLGGEPGEQLTVDALDVIFPGAGFDRFPVGTPVAMVAAGAIAPIVRSTPGGPSLGSIEMGGLTVELQALVAGEPVPVIRIVLDATAGLGLAVDADGTLGAVLDNPVVSGVVVGSFPGGNFALLQTGLDFLAAFLVPQLTAALGQIPVPSPEAAGLALEVNEVGLSGPLSDYLGFWGELSIIPVEAP